jgi:MFS family permease
LTSTQGRVGTSPALSGRNQVLAGLLLVITLAAMSLGWSLSSTFSSRLHLRIGFRDAALIGMTLAVVAALALGLLPGSSPLWGVTAASLLLGAGIGLPSTSLMVGMQSVIGWERRGVATGASMFTRMLGSAVGAAALGSVANSTLAGWFRRAPGELRGRLPSVNSASEALGGGSRVPDAVADYVRQGLDLASHRVFHALAAVAILGIAAVLVAPRRFRTLRFEEQAPDQSRHAA